MDCTLPGSSVHGISQTRILEWFAISLSRGSYWRYRFAPLLTQGSNLHLQIGRWILSYWNTREASHLDANVKQTVYLFWKFPRPEFLSCNLIHCMGRCHLAMFASTSGNKALTNWWKKKSKYSAHSYCC